MSWTDDIEKEFKDCLKAFPEIKEDIGLIVAPVTSNEFAGIMGHRGAKEFIILVVPNAFEDNPEGLRSVIFHELSHIISKGSEECEKIFYGRADEKSKLWWTRFKISRSLVCEDLRS